jgi:hypothetical protein
VVDKAGRSEGRALLPGLSAAFLGRLLPLVLLALSGDWGCAPAEEHGLQTPRSPGMFGWLVGAGALSLLGLLVVRRRRQPDWEREPFVPPSELPADPPEAAPPQPPAEDDESEPLTEADLISAETPDDAAAAPSSDLPEQLGPYLLIDRIGEGGLAEVFTAARYAPDGSVRPLVVKRLRRERSEDAMAVMHFIAEKEVGASLVHPNITAIVDFGEVNGTRFLAEEYIAGRDVGRLTRRMVELKQRPLSATAILYVAHEVLSALEYAHTRLDDQGLPLDLVHRDVTPDNILISERGEVKLLDFGIAQIRGSSGQGTSGNETVKGNVDFMSPEQACGQTVDHRADLFSVGLVIYYCAARAPLYRGKTLYDRLLAAAGGAQQRERDFIAGLPPPLPSFLPGLLATDPDQRFPTARQARELIAPYCVGAAAELAEVVGRLFGEEIRRERARLEMALGPARGRHPVPSARFSESA